MDNMEKTTRLWFSPVLRPDPRHKLNGDSPTAFRPHPLLRNGHLQTLFGTFGKVPQATVVAEKHHVSLEDGDVLCIHDVCPPQWANNDPVAVMVHGLCGSHQAPYLVRLVESLYPRGIRTIRIDMRGCGDSRMTCHSASHAGRSSDVRAVLQYVQNIAPAAPIWLVGISLGGNQILKLLGESIGSDSPSFASQGVTKAVAVAPPVSLKQCADNLERWSLRPYSQFFIRELLGQVSPLVKQNPDWQKVRLDPMPRTMREFDERVTAPLSGFSGADDYYHQAAAYPHLSKLKVPTLVLASEDDPIVPAHVIRQAPWSKQVELEFTRHGGHLGYVSWRSGQAWLETRIANWLLRST